MEENITIKNDLSKAPKTGEWRYMRPEVDKEKCKGCQTCVHPCPEAAIEIKPCENCDTDKADIDYDFCKGCGVCAQVCPNKAIIMKKN